MAVVIASRERLDRPWVAIALLGAALAVTILTTVQAARGWASTPGWVLVELVVDVGLLVGDGYAFEAGQALAGNQSLAGQFPIVGVVNAGFVLGPWLGLASGAVVGSSIAVGVWVNGIRTFEGDDYASLGSSIAFYALWGGVAGWVGRLLARAEEEVASTRAREDVARTLHDGVLQTLALVERRTETSDPELARLARDTDRDLRAYLWEKPVAPGHRADLGSDVRDAALRAGRSFDLEVTISALDDTIYLGSDEAAAFAGAVGEAIVNVGKHAGSQRAVVFVDRGEDGTVFVSVRDDGRGFDAAGGTSGRGVAGSIVARMVEVGGRAEVASQPGSGTEVRLWLP